MNEFNRKVAIVGMGNVGMGTALTILHQGFVDELLLIDIQKNKVLGEVMDMNNAVAFFPHYINVRCADYEDLSNVDVLCIAASACPPAGGDRLAELDSNIGIIRTIVRKAVDNGFKGIFLIQSNPVDVLTYVALDESKFPPNRVIGGGTLLDSGRLREVISRICGGVNVDSIRGLSIGEHGNSQTIIWSSVSVGGKPYLDMRKDNPELYTTLSLEEIEKEVIGMAWEIIDKKGCTAYGIGSSASCILRSIFNNEKRILPVSTLLNGEYGQKDIVASVPCVIDNKGVKSIIELNMTDEEKAKLDNSFSVIRNYTHRK